MVLPTNHRLMRKLPLYNTVRFGIWEMRPWSSVIHKDHGIVRIHKIDRHNRCAHIVTKNKRHLQVGYSDFLVAQNTILWQQLDLLRWGNLYYTEYTIIQQNGKRRTISTPSPDLKSLQKQVKDILSPLAKSYLHPHATWFRPWYSTKHNATIHKYNHSLITIDLEDFFPHITHLQVFTSLIDDLDISSADALAICSIAMFHDSLPQWSPLSPLLSNIVATKLDNTITKELMLIDKNITYSRYADDITIWLPNHAIPTKIICSLVENLAKEQWFFINHKKTKILHKYNRQEITWLVVNSWEITLPRKKRMLYRAIFHNLKKYWLYHTHQQYNKIHDMDTDLVYFFNKISGIASYVYDIHPQLWSQYLSLIKIAYDEFLLSLRSDMIDVNEPIENVISILEENEKDR